MPDRRQFIIDRLRLVVQQIKPGLDFAPFTGVTHRAIETNLKGRAWGKLRNPQRPPSEEMPFVEIITEPEKPDQNDPYGDRHMYHRKMGFLFMFCCSDPKKGTNLQPTVLPQLNALLADLCIAIEAFPKWYDASQGAPTTAEARCGAILTIMKGSETEAGTDRQDGYGILRYEIEYSFNVFEP